MIYTPKSNPAVSIAEMHQTLNTLIASAPNFDKKLLAYVDGCTIDRESFDFYSWKYWGYQSDGYSSISAFATDVYTKYNRFRALENRDWKEHWRKHFTENRYTLIGQVVMINNTDNTRTAVTIEAVAINEANELIIRTNLPDPQNPDSNLFVNYTETSLYQ